VRRQALTILLCAGCWLAAGAQSTFTEQLQQSRSGEGKVTVTHDQSIDKLVNTPDEQPAKTHDADREADKPDKYQQVSQEIILSPDTTDTDYHKKVMRNSHKISGYRVQVFAGGNSRSDRLKAERTGDEIKTLFPNEPVYVHFYSPRWICRMGNYRTYEEAHEILRNVKQLGYNSAIIVKGKITVQQP